MTENLLSAEDLAERLDAPSAAWVLKRARAEGWPCVKFTRKTIKFRPEHVEQIIALYEREQPASALGPRLPGQTERSRRRAS